MLRNRRDVLRQAAALPMVALSGRAWAAPAPGIPRLLLVFLRGGYDALSAVVPISSDAYYQARPTIALARPDPTNSNACVSLDGDWGLHPALAASLLPFWRSRQLAFVPFTGTSDMSRSHFETQETIELGQPLEGNRDFRSGFMGRLAECLSGGRPIAFTTQPPLCFGSKVLVPNVGPTLMSERPTLGGHSAALIEDMYRAGRGLDVSVREGFRIRDAVWRSAQGDRPDAMTSRGFPMLARRIGLLMRDNFNLACVDVGDWDTHVLQGGAQGELAGRLGELGRGLAAFADALGRQAWRDSVVVVISEFGRTFRENGDRGTDHGHGTTFWVMGGGVHGEKIAGNQVAVTLENLNEGRDLPVLTDYRSMLGGLFRRFYGLSHASCQAVFPQTQPTELGLL